MGKLAISYQLSAISSQRSVVSVLRLVVFRLWRLKRRREIGKVELASTVQHDLNLTGHGETAWNYGSQNYFWAGATLYVAERDIQLRARFWRRHDRILYQRLNLTLFSVCVPVVSFTLFYVVRFLRGG